MSFPAVIEITQPGGGSVDLLRFCHVLVNRGARSAILIGFERQTRLLGTVNHSGLKCCGMVGIGYL